MRSDARTMGISLLRSEVWRYFDSYTSSSVHNYRPNEVSLAERTNKQNAPHLVRILPFVKVVRDRPRRTYRGIVDESPAPHACQFLYLGRTVGFPSVNISLPAKLFFAAERMSSFRCNTMLLERPLPHPFAVVSCPVEQQ
jgi:hypothetical protein